MTATEQTTPSAQDQVSANKMQVANSIISSFLKLKECTCEYEKSFINKGIALNFEYLGRLELSKMQQEMVESMAASEAAKKEAEVYAEEALTPVVASTNA